MKMTSGVLAAIAVFFGAGAMSASWVHAELHSGTAYIPTGLVWDFSDSLATHSPGGDLYTIIVAAESGPAGGHESSRGYPWFFSAVYPALVAYAPPDTSYADLETAPTDSTYYFGVQEVFSGQAYVLRTTEHHFVKFQVLSYSDIHVEIEYVYQDNGTNVLVNAVPVRQTTWGHVKALYR